MKYGKLLNGGMSIIDTEDPLSASCYTLFAIGGLKHNGWKETVLDPKPELVDFQGLQERYEESANKITVHYDVIQCDKNKVEDHIRELKESLAASDYKIQKNLEYRDAGLELPYNPVDLHNVRQPIRDEINRLEALIAHE